jgi:hypothetical protein
MRLAHAADRQLSTRALQLQGLVLSYTELSSLDTQVPQSNITQVTICARRIAKTSICVRSLQSVGLKTVMVLPNT